MTFIYSPFDVVLKPMAEDEDVWFGFMFHGWAAKVGGVVHWLVYAALAWGLWRMEAWVWILGSLYTSQVALAMFLWPIMQTDSGSLISSLIAGGLFGIPAVAFWRSKPLFTEKQPFSEKQPPTGKPIAEEAQSSTEPSARSSSE
jgi:hypothetical protein